MKLKAFATEAKSDKVVEDKEEAGKVESREAMDASRDGSDTMKQNENERLRENAREKIEPRLNLD